MHVGQGFVADRLQDAHDIEMHSTASSLTFFLLFRGKTNLKTNLLKTNPLDIPKQYIYATFILSHKNCISLTHLTLKMRNEKVS